MLSRYSGRRVAVSTQVVAIAVVVLMVVAGAAGYFLFLQPGSGAQGGAPQSSLSSATAAGATTGAQQSQTQILTSGSATTPSNSPITVGVLTELTGPTYAPLGNEEWLMVNLAAKEINGSGGVMGHPIKLIKYDSQTSTTVALEGARVLDQTDNVLVLTGPASTDDALAVKGYVEANGVPFVVAQAASPDLTSPGTQWTFRIEINAVGQGAALGKYLANAHPGSKVALVYENTGYVRQETAGVRYILNTYKNDSMSIVYDQIFPTTQTDWSAAVAALKLAGANEIVEVGAGTSAPNLFSTLMGTGYTVSNIWPVTTPTTLATGGPNVIGMIGETFGDETTLEQTANGTAFVNKVAPLLNACVICLNGAKVFSVSQAIYYDYVSIYMIAAAAKQVLQSGLPLTRQNFVNAMRQVPLPNDPNGYPQHFDANGANQGPPYYIEQMTTYNGTTQKYHGKVLTTINFASSLPVYNITKLPTT